MKNKYPNELGSERTVETQFMFEILDRCDSETKILDVGGIPSDAAQFERIASLIKDKRLDYKICDFRGGQYRGDFVSYDFKNEKFNLVIFLSSLEHFPQCTEGDRVYREGEDIRGFEKALEVLNDNGQILLTVPFGKQRWQEYHQNYNLEGLLKLTKGAKIVEQYIYRLADSTENKQSGRWVLEGPEKMEDVIYTDRAFGCGCFLLKKT